MFAVKIYIYTDEDFGFEEPEFNVKDDEEKIFYFENREDAVNAFIRSFHNLKNYLRPWGIDYVKRWIDSMDNRVELIAKKIRTFRIAKDFGNQSLLYELFETERIEHANGSFCFNSKNPEIDFSWYEEETIRWDELVNFPDIE